ncbi:hypothetical protein [Anaerotalea alkaliphila]|uniref:CSD1 domain-containing protein n=1 Tax=Anaerotalea alkaliphila TaxID=2662126 RepID=A0A7X5KP02_9FIRM|nr:hypothetical protein [Anaerotalea alkaliphila]NDL68489.1 hypothetical protein [Anaerotalea alkaliphila]
MAKMKIKGLKELEKTLKDIEKKVNKSFNSGVSVDVLFSESFMNRYSDFSSFSEFLQSGSFEVNSQEDLEALDDEKINEHVRATTKFSSWQKMIDAATEIYTKNVFDNV